jgi:hypothetical protein
MFAEKRNKKCYSNRKTIHHFLSSLLYINLISYCLSLADLRPDSRSNHVMKQRLRIRLPSSPPNSASLHLLPLHRPLNANQTARFNLKWQWIKALNPFVGQFRFDRACDWRRRIAALIGSSALRCALNPLLTLLFSFFRGFFCTGNVTLRFVMQANSDCFLPWLCLCVSDRTISRPECRPQFLLSLSFAQVQASGCCCTEPLPRQSRLSC